MEAKSSGIVRAMAAVMAEVEGVRKDRKGPGYKYTGHDDVTDVLRDAFIKCGIVQSVSTKDVTLSEFGLRMTVVVKWTATEDGTCETSEVPGIAEPILNRDGKNVRPMDLGVGVGMSYAVKYAQLKAFMLVGGVPDAEEPRRGEAPQPRSNNGATRAPANPVSDEQVALLLTEYSAVNSEAELMKLRIAVGAMIDRLERDGEQYKQLQAADERAASRVAGK